MQLHFGVCSFLHSEKQFTCYHPLWDIELPWRPGTCTCQGVLFQLTRTCSSVRSCRHDWYLPRCQWAPSLPQCVPRLLRKTRESDGFGHSRSNHIGICLSNRTEAAPSHSLQYNTKYSADTCPFWRDLHPCSIRWELFREPYPRANLNMPKTKEYSLIHLRIWVSELFLLVPECSLFFLDLLLEKPGWEPWPSAQSS